MSILKITVGVFLGLLLYNLLNFLFTAFIASALLTAFFDKSIEPSGATRQKPSSLQYPQIQVRQPKPNAYKQKSKEKQKHPGLIGYERKWIFGSKQECTEYKKRNPEINIYKCWEGGYWQKYPIYRRSSVAHGVHRTTP